MRNRHKPTALNGRCLGLAIRSPPRWSFAPGCTAFGRLDLCGSSRASREEHQHRARPLSSHTWATSQQGRHHSAPAPPEQLRGHESGWEGSKGSEWRAGAKRSSLSISIWKQAQTAGHVDSRTCLASHPFHWKGAEHSLRGPRAED